MASGTINKEVKFVDFEATSNANGSINVSNVTGINKSQILTIRTTTADQIILDNGNGWVTMYNASLAKLANTATTGRLYYI